jgi:hypothetical protein
MPEVFAAILVAVYVIVAVVPLALLALAIPYAVLRLRNEDPPDPQLGAKIGLQFFFSAAILLFLTGLTITSIDLFTRDRVTSPPKTVPGGKTPDVRPSSSSDDDWFNEAERTAAALILCGLLFAFVHFVLALILTNRHNWARVRRTFVGWRFAIRGIIVMICVTGIVVVFFQKKPFEDDNNFRTMKTFVAILIIWFPSWLLQLGLLKLYGVMSGPEKKPVVLREVEE